MSIRFLFFAQAADWVRRRELTMDLPGPNRITDLIEQQPDLQPINEHRKSLRVAVNREFSDFQCEVKDGDEIAFIPPVSGG